jgi:thiol-disulfide isomerase/thioredoxin
MRKIGLYIFVIFAPYLCIAQKAFIHFDINDTTTDKIIIANRDYTSPQALFGKDKIILPTDNGNTNHSFSINKPQFVSVSYPNASTGRYSHHMLFLSPGDSMTFSIDAHNREDYTITGKGAKNNQPSIQQLRIFAEDLREYENDSLPNSLFSFIKKQSTLQQEHLKKYIDSYNPTDQFIKTHSQLVQYLPLMRYYTFKGSQKFNIGEAYSRNQDKWQSIEDSLTSILPVSNDELLTIPEYTDFLSTYLTREKEKLWQDTTLFDNYFSSHVTANILNEDPENLLKEKIINEHFTGQSAEFLYAILFQEAMNENQDNLLEIFSRFKQKYPTSQYTAYISPTMEEIEKRSKQVLSDKMVLIENHDSFDTFDDILPLVKGKTVLLDMWGTWCGPCRAEFLNHTDAIKERYDDKELDFLYIANYDVGKEKKWKELIAYYNLTGTHLMASEQLTEDIMKKVEGSGFPTYVIFKRDGSFELSKAGYPMNRDILFEQLDEALNYMDSKSEK